MLVIHTFASSVPQLRRISFTRNATGIPLPYALLPLITATEHFMLIFCTALIVPGEQSWPSAGEWLNISQAGIVW